MYHLFNYCYNSYVFEYIMLHALKFPTKDDKCLYLEDTAKFPLGRPVHYV